MNRLAAALTRAISDLRRSRHQVALVGGFAVSARAEPRFTRDLDFAVAVTADRDAETLARDLLGQGYASLAVMEQQTARRLATIRLRIPGEGPAGVVLDLLFASSGIEPEIVAAAEELEILSGLRVPVARTHHLIALKVLSRSPRRPQDDVDLAALLAVASSRELEDARGDLRLIAERGFARGKDLDAELETVRRLLHRAGA